MPARLSASTLEHMLERVLEAVLSSRRTASEPAKSLSHLDREQQEFVLHWLRIIAKTNAELAYQFVANASHALQTMEQEQVRQWIMHGLDIYDRDGLYPGSSALREVEGFIASVGRHNSRVTLDESQKILGAYVNGLSGRSLRIESNEQAYTDSEVLYLPPSLFNFDDARANFKLYKAHIAHLWAQIWFGTFQKPSGQSSLSTLFKTFDSPKKAQELFYLLETIRLDACIVRELPGLAREMSELQKRVGEVELPARWSSVVDELKQPAATVADTRRTLARLYPTIDELPIGKCYQGELRAEISESAMEQRQQREKEQFQQELANLCDDLALPYEAMAGASIEQSCEGQPATEQSYSLNVDEQTINPNDQFQSLLQSITQDFGEVPDDYWQAANFQDSITGDNPNDSAKKPQREVVQGDVISYDEWDFRRQNYRKGWCYLREHEVQLGEEAFVETTLHKYAGVVSELRKTFEALRTQVRPLTRQREGDDIDLDAFIEAYSDIVRGNEMSEHVFRRMHTQERDMAVVFMVDMSGSTKGWINDAERESLVLLCEALEVLGDRYAIFGFSGMTRKRCELFRIKGLHENYNDNVKRRISGMRPQDYTRMGVIIRHLTQVLTSIDAQTRLLITLSDGKPDDYDGYRGEYGIEDTRRALIEAKRAGVHPFCITIDSEARSYLPHMYGAVNYTVVDDVRRLPAKVSDIYRRLTT